MKDTDSMAPRKLSDSDKGDIIELYKQPDQTTSTLAEQYGVSNSTVSRILKTTLPPEEYSALISQKRMASADKTSADGVSAEADASAKKRRSRARKQPTEAEIIANAISEPTQKAPLEETPQTPRLKLKTAEAQADDDKPAISTRRRRRRSKAEDSEQLPLLDESMQATEDPDAAEDPKPSAPASVPDTAPASLPAPILASSTDPEEDEEDDDDDDDDLLGLDETLGDDFGDDDDEEEEDDDDDDGIDVPKPKLKPTVTLSIMPLGEAVLPKPCYLVVDMRSELITRPLSDFADLGQIPSEEERAKTLPVFDNHRVARRFSRNKQRVIKVPDGSLITRTSPYLQAKGITRLLVDGQVFDLATV